MTAGSAPWFQRLSPWLAGCGLVAFLGAAGLCGGFLLFAQNVTAEEAGTPPVADGMVVLTGDNDRIPRAVQLLAEGRAKRLLISGVDPLVEKSELADLVPRHRDLFACCVDLGYRARNTLGNGEETETWAREHAIRHSLIVVTSTYHMPRALTEIGSRLTGIDLIPYPVRTDRERQNPWWRDRTTARIFGREYLKFLAARARTALQSFGPHAGATAEVAMRPSVTGQP